MGEDNNDGVASNAKGNWVAQMHLVQEGTV